MTVTTFQFTCKKDDTRDVVGIARELCGASGPGEDNDCYNLYVSSM